MARSIYSIIAKQTPFMSDVQKTDVIEKSNKVIPITVKQDPPPKPKNNFPQLTINQFLALQEIMDLFSDNSLLLDSFMNAIKNNDLLLVFLENYQSLDNLRFTKIKAEDQSDRQNDQVVEVSQDDQIVVSDFIENFAGIVQYKKKLDQDDQIVEDQSDRLVIEKHKRELETAKKIVIDQALKHNKIVESNQINLIISHENIFLLRYNHDSTSESNYNLFIVIADQKIVNYCYSYSIDTIESNQNKMLKVFYDEVYKVNKKLRKTPKKCNQWTSDFDQRTKIELPRYVKIQTFKVGDQVELWLKLDDSQTHTIINCQILQIKSGIVYFAPIEIDDDLNRILTSKEKCHENYHQMLIQIPKRFLTDHKSIDMKFNMIKIAQHITLDPVYVQQIKSILNDFSIWNNQYY